MIKEKIKIDKSKTLKAVKEKLYKDREHLFKDNYTDDLKQSLTPETYSLFKMHRLMFFAISGVAYALFGLAYWDYSNNQGSIMVMYSGLINFFLVVLIVFNYRANWYFLMKKLKFNMGQVEIIQKNKKIFRKFVDLNKYPVYVNKSPHFPDPRTVIMDGNMPTFIFKQGCTGSIDFDGVKEYVMKDGRVQANSVVDAKLVDNILSAQEEVVESKKKRDVVKDLWKLMRLWVIITAIGVGITAALTYTMYNQWTLMFPDGKISADIFLNAITNSQGG